MHSGSRATGGCCGDSSKHCAAIHSAPASADEALMLARDIHMMLDPVVACLTVIWFAASMTYRFGRTCISGAAWPYGRMATVTVNTVVVGAVGAEKWAMHSIQTQEHMLVAQAVHFVRVMVLQLCLAYLVRNPPALVTFGRPARQISNTQTSDGP